MATLSQLQEWRERLMDAKFSGVLMVQDSSGESIRYRSHAELAAALASLDAEIQRMGGNRPSASITFNTSKGL
ncbi:MAG: phage head-tail joining protein [Paenirhodobacter sp.]|uniref:phage head-tail joining protein n=1 Tax=Paenirhodobacter sp. TaxID=1965326 RepID=UPI003D1191BD